MCCKQVLPNLGARYPERLLPFHSDRSPFILKHGSTLEGASQKPLPVIQLDHKLQTNEPSALDHKSLAVDFCSDSQAASLPRPGLQCQSTHLGSRWRTLEVKPPHLPTGTFHVRPPAFLATMSRMLRKRWEQRWRQALSTRKDMFSAHSWQMAVAQKLCTQNGALVNGHLDYNLRSCGGLILTHTQMMLVAALSGPPHPPTPARA